MTIFLNYCLIQSVFLPKSMRLDLVREGPVVSLFLKFIAYMGKLNFAVNSRNFS